MPLLRMGTRFIASQVSPVRFFGPTVSLVGLLVLGYMLFTGKINLSSFDLGTLANQLGSAEDPTTAITAVRLDRSAPRPEDRIRVAQGVVELARGIGCSPSQLALAWLLQRPRGNIIPILGARKLEQFNDNMGCLAIELNATQIQALDDLAPPASTYPASLFATDFYRQMLHGSAKVER